MPVRDELMRLGTHDAAAAEAVVRELLALPGGRRPTAVFAGNNRHTIGALRAVRGAEPPVALVGFDDFELADLLGITVVRHDSPKMGAHAWSAPCRIPVHQCARGLRWRSAGVVQTCAPPLRRC